MATTTQLIQKYKTIQKSTSSVPTVLYLKLRLFLTDSDRMCDSDILTIYSYAKLAQASLRAYQVREAPLKFMQALFEMIPKTFTKFGEHLSTLFTTKKITKNVDRKFTKFVEKIITIFKLNDENVIKYAEWSLCIFM